MAAFERIKSGIPGLDKALDNIRLGDNVVWNVKNLNEFSYFVNPYVKQAKEDNRNLIYIRFANHPPLIEMNEEDFKFLSKLLEKSKTLKVVTLEYGTIKVGTVIGNPPVVAYGIVNERAKEEVYTQLLRLKEMLKK